MMMLEYTAHSAAAEIRSLAMPSGTQTAWASLGIESHASLSSIAVRRTGDALEALRVLVGTELVVALRAIRHAGRTPAGAGTRRLFELADEALPGGLEDRAFGLDVELACAVLERWSGRSGVERRLADAP